MKTKLIVLFYILVFGYARAQNPDISLVEAFPNLTFNKALHLNHSGDGTNRIFVVSQTGMIYVFPNDSNVQATQMNTFLNITNKISSSNGEEGLLGLAFHPDYNSNGYIYINYTAGSPFRTVISRFRVLSGNPNKIDSMSEYKILEIIQPFFNHNGGTVMFGQDGYLYIGMGDGGLSADPNNNAQNLQSLLGKMLRININDTTPSRRYVIPPTNPFYNNPSSGREEIYAWGFRNPWKFSQDNQTGKIYVGDVGETSWEEIDILEIGKNYGWKVMEGFVCFSPPTGCDTSGKKVPIKAYNHTTGDCSITGGYVYRGGRRPELRGAYIYGDYCSGRIWMLRYNNGVVVSDSLLTQKSISLTSFGTDQYNELYIVSSAVEGKIWRFNKSPNSIGINEAGITLSDYELFQNYPNPFNPSTMISYYIPKTGAVKLQVYDVNGKLVRTLVNSSQSSGRYNVNFNGTDDNGINIPSGIYFYTLSSGDFTETRKMLMIK